MTEEQWNLLLDTIDGKLSKPIPSGFLIDSPWLPGWYGISTLDYYTNNKYWLEANFKAINTFPELMFLPGFWSEYGMCTEPSAFGAKTVWSKNNLPHADKIIYDISDIDKLLKPNVKTDGLLPFMINRLVHSEKIINDAGHSIKFAITRGPLNIASFLMGTTEFLLATQMYPEKIHKFLKLITDFTIDWLELQTNSFKTIDGILLLDDIIGFVGENDFKTFALPYLKEIFQYFDFKVKFFHNDSEGIVCSPYLNEIGVNLFNYSFNHSVNEIKELTENKITLLGNIPPRDVMALGKPDDVKDAVVNSIGSVKDKSRIILSCGGGMPQDVPTENIRAFIAATIQPE
ncbi:uroporphyrinogen decarboxylase family protein [Bacteroidota bacterium]